MEEVETYLKAQGFAFNTVGDYATVPQTFILKLMQQLPSKIICKNAECNARNKDGVCTYLSDMKALGAQCCDKSAEGGRP